MISFSPQQRYFLFRQATDMRKSYDGLSGIVTNELKRDLFTGDVFIFINKSRNRIKLLVWDRTGFWVCGKRLEQGTFQLPENTDKEKEIQVSWDTLIMIMEGINIDKIQRRKRYTRAA